jgi:hypothetical protein
LKFKFTFVGQYQVTELFDFEGDVASAMTETSQSPFWGTVQLFNFLLVYVSGFYLTIQKPDFAFSARTFTPAGKLDPEFMKYVNQRSLVVYQQFFAKWVQTDGMFFHMLIFL